MLPETRLPPGSPAAELDRALGSVVRRMRAADAARAAAAAALAGAALYALLQPRGGTWAMAVALLGAGVVMRAAWWRRRPGRSRRAAAARIEAAHPEFRNVIVTAEELSTHPERASDWMRARVLLEASSRASAVRASAVVPMGGPVALAAAAAAIWIAVVVGLPARAATAITDVAGRLTGAPVSAAGLRIVVELRAPEYTRVQPRQLVNPERIDAIAGTGIRLRVAAGTTGWRLRFGSTTLPLRREGDDVIADSTLSESGYFAIEPSTPASAPGQEHTLRSLIPVTVTPDHAPAIRVEAPGRDLLLPGTASRVGVTASATDDFALHSLELRYTKVSGSGEQFEFEEGVIPLALTKESGRAWRGQADLALDALKMAPGDALVYRAVGRDARSGDAGLATSDTYFVEIQGPGHVALEGIEMPPDEERYALSQQMVVLKIERLRQRERTMPRAEVEEAAASIAAEQRSVRANFIFLMGGHVEDEFEEAEQSHEIQEGRLENSARREISAAIHQMTLAEQGLTAASTSRALPPAKAAVEALQRAFGRNRYILRTLAARSRIDPSRRLSGELKGASDWRRDVAAAAADPARQAARTLLTEAMEIADALHNDAGVPPARITALAEQALRIEPGSAEWQSVAAALVVLADVVRAARPAAEVAARLGEAIAPIVAAAQKDARLPAQAGSAPPGALRSAWAGEVRR